MLREKPAMQRNLIAFATLVCLTIPVLSQGFDERTGVNAPLGKVPSTADFVRLVAINDMFEIQSGKPAEKKADLSSQKFAAQMVADHTRTMEELKALALKAGIEFPTAIDSAYQSRIDKLNRLMGLDFDRVYDAMQVEAHQDAVALFARYAEGGDNPDLKAWAAETLPRLRHHLEMAKALRD
jgi:putative membrane protein